MSGYIEADALKRALVTNGFCNDIDMMMTLETINNATTIEAEPVRHGKWIIEDGHVCCSECGEISKEYNWCPYCGARMDAEND